MEDDKIKDLLGSFQPEISPSARFMDNLKRNLEAVEIVKLHNRALKRRNRVAVAIAAACGFAMGLIVAPLLPVIEAWASDISVSFPSLPVGRISVDFSIISWIVAAAACILTSINAYEIAMAKLAAKDSDAT